VNDPVGAAAFVTDLSGVAYIQGRLPNDRPHQFKLYGQRALGYGVSVGATLFWLSGTPISELGVTQYGPPYYTFLSPRGSLGRTPSIYDLSLRIAYDPPLGSVVRGRPRMLLDVYHVGNPRRPVVFDQVRFFDAAQTSPNPNYGQTLFFQPSIAYRVGLEVRW